MNLLLALLSGATVTMAMRVVGVLLVGVLTVIPVLASLQLATGFRATLLLSMAFGVTSVVAGLALAFYWDLPAGGGRRPGLAGPVGRCRHRQERLEAAAPQGHDRELITQRRPRAARPGCLAMLLTAAGICDRL